MERGAADLAGERADVDDSPAPALPHHLERGGATMKGPGEVDRDDPLPIHKLRLQHLDHAQASGGVDPELQRARLGRGALGHVEHRNAIRDVQVHRQQTGARLDRDNVAAVDAVAVGKERLAGGLGPDRPLPR
jgi:hypothetical protein